MTQTEFTTLVEQAAAGDKTAFASLCNEKARDVLYICTSLMGNVHDGEDAAQEVFLQMQNSILRLQQPQAFTAWLNRLIANTCKNMLYGARKAQGISLDILEYEIEEMQMEFLPAEFAEQQEKRQIVLDAMRALPYRYRETLLLFYYENLSTAEMAEVMETNTLNVRKLLHRSRNALKKQVEARLGQSVNSVSEAVVPLGAAATVMTKILKLDAMASLSDSAVARLAAVPMGAATVAAAAGATAPGATTGVAAALAGLKSAVLAHLPAIALTATAVAVSAATVIGFSNNSSHPVTQAAFVQHEEEPVAEGAAQYPAGSGIESAVAEEPGVSPSTPGSLAMPPSTAQEAAASASGGGAAGGPAANGPAEEDRVNAPASGPAEREDYPPAVASGPSRKSSSAAAKEVPENPPAASTEAARPASSRVAGGESQPPESAQGPGMGDDPGTGDSPSSGEGSSSGDGPGPASGPAVPEGSNRYTGALQFLDSTGRHRPEYDTMAQSFRVEVYAGEDLVATPVVDEAGRFAFVLEKNNGALEIRATPSSGFGPAGAGLVTTLQAGETALSPLGFTDTFAPTATLTFLDSGDAPQEGRLNPASALITVYDATQTTVEWRIADENGSELLRGTGVEVPLSGIPAQSGLALYTIYCDLTDCAGNTATAQWDFATL